MVFTAMFSLQTNASATLQGSVTDLNIVTFIIPCDFMCFYGKMKN